MLGQMGARWSIWFSPNQSELRTLSVKNSRVASVYFTSMCLKYLEMLMANLQLGPFVTAEVARTILVF